MWSGKGEKIYEFTSMSTNTDEYIIITSGEKKQIALLTGVVFARIKT